MKPEEMKECIRLLELVRDRLGVLQTEVFLGSPTYFEIVGIRELVRDVIGPLQKEYVLDKLEKTFKNV